MALKIGTSLFNVNVKGIKELKRYLTNKHNYYVGVSDQGGARFSKRAAAAFVTYVRNAFLTGKYENQVPALKPKYAAEKAELYPGKPIGVASEDMVSNIVHFRSRAGGGDGHAVGVRDSFGSSKLSWLTYGTVKQVPRPIFTYAFDDFMAEEFPEILREFRFERERR